MLEGDLELLAHLRGEIDFRFAPTDGDNRGLRGGDNRRIDSGEKGLIAGAGEVDQLFGSGSERAGNLNVECDLEFLVANYRSRRDAVLPSSDRHRADGRRLKAALLEIGVQIGLQKAAFQLNHG